MNWTSVVVSLGGLGALIGAIVALLKIRPEAGQIAVSAAQGAVIVQTHVIDNLRTEQVRLQEIVEGLEERIISASSERNQLRTENEQLHLEVQRLELRVAELEARPSSSLLDTLPEQGET